MPSYSARQATMEAFRPIADEVAAQLGTGWQYRQVSVYTCTLNGPDDMRLVVSGSLSGPGQVRIAGSYPNDTTGIAARELAINVSVSRGARVIALEIQRRLLPSYIAELTTVREEAERARARTQRMRIAVARLTEALPHLGRPYGESSGLFSQHLAGGGSVRVRVNSAGAITLTVETDELREDVLDAIRLVVGAP